MLTCRWIAQRKAKEFVKQHHRHLKDFVGAICCVGCWDDGRLCGVAVIGRPVSRCLDDGTICEITRVATDGTKNACSKLYAQCRRIAQAMGMKAVTYTRHDESGSSLAAVGAAEELRVYGREWTCPSRPRDPSKQPIEKKRFAL